MTLRHALGGSARSIHEAVGRLLDGEDGLILLIDRQRAISYGEGFGLSRCSGARRRAAQATPACAGLTAENAEGATPAPLMHPQTWLA